MVFQLALASSVRSLLRFHQDLRPYSEANVSYNNSILQVIHLKMLFLIYACTFGELLSHYKQNYAE